MKPIISKLFLLSLISLLMFSPYSAHAVLTIVDLECPGDGLITRDTLTGLDWLDVNLTTNQTYDDVRTGVYYAQGFRHATRMELETLFINAGIPDDNFDISITHPTEALELIALLGVTLSTPNRLDTVGFVGSDYYGNVITTDLYPIGISFSALLGKVQFIDLRSSGLLLIGEAHFAGGHPFSDQASPDYGSFLVRDASTGEVTKCKKDKSKDKDKDKDK